MKFSIEVDSKGDYVQVIQSGPLTREGSQSARAESQKAVVLSGIERGLVDYRAVDLTGVPLLMVDVMASSLKSEVPNCKQMALVYQPGKHDNLFRHFKNVCSLIDIEVQLFKSIDEARAWLVGSAP